MTLTIAARQSKEEVIDQLRRLIHLAIFPHMTHEQKTAIMGHIEWMKAQPTDIIVGGRFETIPELLLTKLTFEVAFQPKPEGK